MLSRFVRYHLANHGEHHCFRTFVDSFDTAHNRTSHRFQIFTNDSTEQNVALDSGFVTAFRAVYGAVASHLRERGWLDMAYAWFVDEPAWSGPTAETIKLLHFEYARLGVKVSHTRFPGVTGTPSQRDAGRTHFSPTSLARNRQAVDNTSSWVAHVMQWNTEAAAAAMAEQRRTNGAELLIYDNAIPPLDAPSFRMRTYQWSIWRSNFAVPATRRAGLQGSLFFCINDWTSGDPWTDPMVECCCCGANFSKRLTAGWNMLIYPGVGPGAQLQEQVPLSSSVRWELLRTGLEDSEYFFMLDRLSASAGRACATLADATGDGCCSAHADAEQALTRVSEVAWGFPRMDQFDDATCPYTTNTSLMHEVKEGVATSIEGLLQRPHCLLKSDDILESNMGG